jgi:hypothetical protein
MLVAEDEVYFLSQYYILILIAIIYRMLLIENLRGFHA